MRNIFKALFLAALVSIVPASASLASDPCPEGKTASGACIKPQLAKLMRWQTILMTQSRLSYTAPLAMPGDKQVILPPRPILESSALSQPVGRVRR